MPAGNSKPHSGTTSPEAGQCKAKVGRGPPADKAGAQTFERASESRLTTRAASAIFAAMNHPISRTRLTLDSLCCQAACLAAAFALIRTASATAPALPPSRFLAIETATKDAKLQSAEVQVKLVKSFDSDAIGSKAEDNLRRTMTASRDLNRRLAAGGQPVPVRLQFRPDGKGGFTFDTGVLKGRLHANGKSLGLTEVVHVPTGARLDRSNGLLSHYRVFTTGKRYGGGAWDWPSTAALLDDGQVEVRWPATEDRPFTLRAIYRLASVATIEVETSVESKAPLSGFESFLASYFAPAFTNALVRVKAGATSDLAAATADKGDWQMYPRDAAARQLAEDGRWKLEPNPVAWNFPAEFAGPTAEAQRRAPGLGLVAVIEASATDCFAIALPHQTEGHYSVYLSQFGRNFQPGETARAKVRLVLSETQAQ